jgi:hypothetical protein
MCKNLYLSMLNQCAQCFTYQRFMLQRELKQTWNKRPLHVDGNSYKAVRLVV